MPLIWMIVSLLTYMSSRKLITCQIGHDSMTHIGYECLLGTQFDDVKKGLFVHEFVNAGVVKGGSCRTSRLKGSI